MESQTRWVTQTVYTTHLPRRSGRTSVNKVRENTAVFTAEQQDVGLNIDAAAHHVNTELIITPRMPASMHLHSSADARHERSDAAVSQDAERSWLWVWVDITWKLYMNPVIKGQTCLRALPQGRHGDFFTIKAEHPDKKRQEEFLRLTSCSTLYFLFSTWLGEVKLTHPEVNPVRRALHLWRKSENTMEPSYYPQASVFIHHFWLVKLFFCCLSRSAWLDFWEKRKWAAVKTTGSLHIWPKEFQRFPIAIWRHVSVDPSRPGQNTSEPDSFYLSGGASCLSIKGKLEMWDGELLSLKNCQNNQLHCS